MRKALLCLALALACTANAETVTGRVVGVADGDTITVLDADLVAHQVLTVYHAKRKREAITARPAQNEQHQGHQHRGELDDGQPLDF